MVLKPIPDYGDHMTYDEFKKGVLAGLFTDYDGTGYYATELNISNDEVDLGDVARGETPLDPFTHIVWFNK
jgi:hypothetical protein